MKITRHDSKCREEIANKENRISMDMPSEEAMKYESFCDTAIKYELRLK